jgi:hypothetical protein
MLNFRQRPKEYSQAVHYRLAAVLFGVMGINADAELLIVPKTLQASTLGRGHGINEAHMPRGKHIGERTFRLSSNERRTTTTTTLQLI